MITLLRNLLSSVCIVLLVSSCSGGGGGGGGGGSAPTLVITRSNAGAVADGAYKAQQDLGGTSDLIQGITPFAVNADAVTGNSLLDLVTGLAERHVIGRGNIGPLDVTNCSGGGTVDITEDDGGDADPVGDTLTLDYSACIELGVTIDGAVVLEVTGLTGDPGDPNSDWSVEITFTFVDVVFTADGDTSTFDGALAFAISYDASQSASTLTMSSSGFTGSNSDGVQVSGAFSYSVTLSNTGVSVAFQFTATVGGGTVSVSTSGITLDGNGYSGTVTVTGAGGSSITLSFNGGIVSVMVDENGDGQFECIQDLTVGTLDQFDAANC